MKRFIQFNDEKVEANELLLYERVSRALADAPFLELTERKLMEFRPLESMISMSVFWRHRSEELTHLGRLSDVYILTAGFWRHFSLNEWLDFRREYSSHPLQRFARELLLLIEEFRMIELVRKERPGTAAAFQARITAMLGYHQNSRTVNIQKHFLADALLNKLYISLHAGRYASGDEEGWDLPLERIAAELERAYEAKSTSDSATIAMRIVTLISPSIQYDLTHQYYVLADSIDEASAVFHYHEGMKDAEPGDEKPKETIEEVFRSWHRENAEESGVHLEYELEHGRSGKGTGASAAAGHEEANIEEIGQGASRGDNSSKRQDDIEKPERKGEPAVRAAGSEFGSEHLNVVYEERKQSNVQTGETEFKLIAWREEQRPFVRAFVDEIKKRIEQKVQYRREGLPKGRLSPKLITMVVDERPKPFYRKSAPSPELDAVFGLLVDGSASMLDKLEETKKAVLLFHDVLRTLGIEHEISSYYENADEASKEVQLNVFDMMHTFEERNADSGPAILGFEANDDNRDGFAIRWMAKRLMNRREKHKFLLVFSDGEPSAFGYDRNGIIDTREAVMEAEKQGITVLHLFLQQADPTEDQKQVFSLMFGNKSASAGSVESFAEQTLRLLRKVLTLVINQ